MLTTAAKLRGQRLTLSTPNVKPTAAARAHGIFKTCKVVCLMCLTENTTCFALLNWQNTVGQTNMLTFEWDAFDNAQITGGIGYN